MTPADQGPRPRSRSIRSGRRRRALQPLEIEVAREPYERGRLARGEPVARELGRRVAGERLPRRRQPQPVVLLRGDGQEAPLEPPCRARLDQLAAERLEERMRHRGDAERPHPLAQADRRPDERIVAELLDERRVRVVGGEHEAQRLDRGLRPVDARLELPVRPLPHARGDRRAVDLVRERQDSVPKHPRGVASVACALGEGVGRTGLDRRLHRHEATLVNLVLVNRPLRPIEGSMRARYLPTTSVPWVLAVRPEGD